MVRNWCLIAIVKSSIDRAMFEKFAAVVPFPLHRTDSVVVQRPSGRLDVAQGTVEPVELVAAVVAVLVVVVAAAAAAVYDDVAVVPAAVYVAAVFGAAIVPRIASSFPGSRLSNSLHRFQQRPEVPCTVERRLPAILATWPVRFFASPIYGPLVPTCSPLAGSFPPPVFVFLPLISWSTRSASIRPHLAIVEVLGASPSTTWSEAHDLARVGSLPMGAVGPDVVYSSFVVYCPAKEEDVLRKEKLRRLKRPEVRTHGGYTRSVAWA